MSSNSFHSRVFALVFGAVIPLEVLTGCGRSPMHNHTRAGDNATKTGEKTSSDGNTLRADFDFGDGIFAELDWTSPLRVSANNSFKLTFFEQASKEAPQVVLPLDAPPKINPQMPSMGHGTTEDWEVKLETTPEGQLLYAFSKVNLFMRGTWELQISGTHKGRAFSAKAPIRF